MGSSIVKTKWWWGGGGSAYSGWRVVFLHQHASPVAGLVQVLAVTAAGGHMTPLSLAVDVLTAAQGLVRLRPPIGSLLHDGQPCSQSPTRAGGQ